MREINFRTLRADEIDVRPATIKDGKATILLYIDSRAVVRLLNETVGASDWEMVFDTVNGQVVGKLGIWDDDKGRFVYKSDTGSESNIESSKGLFSDCYKRCLSRWGVDELYTAPRVVVEDDGYGCSGYRVRDIQYNENREIIRLIIVNRFSKVVFDWVDDRYVNKPVAEPKQQGQDNPQAEEYIAILRTFCKDRINAEPYWKNDIIKFGEIYSKKIRNGWNGPFKVNDLYDSWVSKRKVS